MTAIVPEALLVDDRPAEVRELAAAVLRAGTKCRALGPGDVTKKDLNEVDLVVVDFSLEDWLQSISRDPIATCPPDGVALAGIFRQYSDQKAPPTGYALMTGQVGLLGPLPAERRPHVISRLSNVEWFFEKKASATENARQIHELAKAIRSLPANVTRDLGGIDALVRFLRVNQADRLYPRYCDAVLRCRPPLHHLSERSHGLVIVRWLLHRILPHTCFLMDELNLAARLRVTPASLRESFSKDAFLAKELGPLEFCGPLATFDNRRWWRGGIEQWLWDRTDGQAANDDVVLKMLQSNGCQAIVPVGIIHPVVTVDKNLLSEPTLSAFSNAIALRLDDWPDYAEPAYASKETIDKHPEMKAFVSD
jgi:hypothetical protein